MIAAAADAADTAQIRFVNALADAAVADLQVDGAPAISAVAFGAASAYQVAPTGPRLLAVTATGAAPVLASTAITLEAGLEYTALAAGLPGAEVLLVLADDNRETAAGQAHLRIVHAAPDAGLVDVSLVGHASAFTRLGFGDVWSYTPVGAGTYDVRVVPSEPEAAAPLLAVSGLTLAEGHVYTLFLMGLAEPAAGQPALRAVLSADAAPPARLRFLHAAADRAGLDVRLDGAALFAGVPFSSTATAGAITDYVEVPPGEHLIEVAPAEGGPALTALPFNATSGRDYTAVALHDARLAALTDNNALPALGMARVRLLHAVADYPAVDLFADGALLLADVPLDTASAYLALAGGLHDLQIRRAGASDVLATLPAALLQEGHVYTLVFKGHAVGSPALQAELVADVTTRKTTQAMYIVSPVEPGEWGVKLSGDFGPEDNYLLTVLGRVPAPALVGLSVAQTGPLNADVSWQLTSPVLATQVSIYANAGPIIVTQVITHTDGTTETVTSDLFTGQPLITGLTGAGSDWVDGSHHVQAVDLSGLPGGSYRIWVEAADDGNAPVRAYAPEPVVVARSWPATWNAKLTVTPDYRRLDIEWQPGPNPDVGRYLLHLAQPATDTLTFDVGATNSYSLAALTPGQPYTVTVDAIPADDAEGAAAPARSESVVATPLGGMFALAVHPAQIALRPGEAQTVTLTVTTALDPYPDAVGLYAGMLPDEFLVRYAPAIITPTLAGATATVVISATQAATEGAYVLPLVASGGGVSVTSAITVSLLAPALMLSADPAAVLLDAGGTISITLDVTASSALAGGVDLALPGAPLGLEARFIPGSVAPGTSATLVLSDTALLQGGDYELMVGASSGAITQQLPLALSVYKPGFALWSDFVTLVIRPGEQAIFPLDLTGLDWTQPISLTLAVSDIIPGGVLDLSLTPDGPAQTSLDLLAPATAFLRAQTGITTPAGSYAVRVLAKSGGRERTLPLLLRVVDPAAAADLYITQRPTRPVIAGEVFTQTVTVVNGGPLPASGIVLTNTLPAGAGFVSASYLAGQAECVPELGRLVCTIAALPAGGQVALNLALTAPVNASHGAALVNVAEVRAASVDNEPANNRSARIIPVVASADLEALAFDIPGQVQAGGELVYVLFARNHGPTAARQAMLFNDLPPGVQLTNASTSHGSCSTSGQRVTCALGELASGATAVITLRATVAPAARGVLVNRAFVTSERFDSLGANNAVEAMTLVIADRTFLPLVLAGRQPNCAEGIRNGGFEENTAWTFPITASTAGYSTAQKHSGQRSARFGLLPGTVLASPAGLGAPERNLAGEYAPLGASYSSGYQTVRIPADVASATLSFWYRSGSVDPANDFQRVMLLRPGSYSLLKVLMRVAENNQVWRQMTFDLNVYRGQDVVVYFEVYNNSTGAEGRSWMYLDDVSLALCR